uniref:Insecticidal toxin OcyC10 n=1 Tax=Opisthacanthus cayaporum TaxID=573324 RepID=TX10_OPICY
MNFATKIVILLLVAALILAVTSEKGDSSSDDNEAKETEGELPLSDFYGSCVRPKKCKPHLKCNAAQICVFPKTGR